MAKEHFAIIGNGAAANAAADVLRARDKESRITLISDEFFPFYYRHLLREYIVGDREEEGLIVRPPAYFKERSIRLRLGQRVTRVDLDSRTLFLSHMEKVRFDHLLLCTGSKPRVPEVFETCSDCFTVMNTLTHARVLRKKLASVEHMLIAGGDLVSYRIAVTLRTKGTRVTFLIDKDSFWPLSLTPERRTESAGALSAKGVEVVEDDALVRVTRGGTRAYSVHTKKGSTVECDLVGAFFGLIPDVAFLLGSGLDIERGLLVDEHLCTNVAGIYAAGDCAQVYNPSIRNYWVSIGWPNAQRLGHVAAENMVGTVTRAEAPAVSVLTTDGITVQTGWWREF